MGFHFGAHWVISTIEVGEANERKIHGEVKERKRHHKIVHNKALDYLKKKILEFFITKEI